MSRHRRPAARADARRERFSLDRNISARSSLVSAFNDMEAREEKRRLEEILSKQIGVDDTCSVSRTFLLTAPFVCDRTGVVMGSEDEKINVDHYIRNSEPIYHNREQGIILYR